jgi:L-lactate dehydrogenase complex protein LldE
VGIASLQLLEKLGCEVDFPKNQTCCGQPMANSGFQHITGEIDKQNQELFKNADYVVCPSGSCTLHLKDHVFHEKTNVMELCEFMTDVLKVNNLEASFPHKVGLHQSCHGLRGLKMAKSSELVSEPYSKMEPLLAMVKGLDLKIPEKVDECCGFGGTFAVSEEAVSAKMGQDRCQDFEEIDVDFITSPDMSCLMHLEGILKRKGSKTRVIHVAEILNSSIQ